eukprot:46311_1
MSSEEEDSKNEVTFTIEIKCGLIQNCDNPNETKDIKFKVELPFNHKQQIPFLSEWETKCYSFDLLFEFTKSKVIEWCENGIMSITPILNTKTIDDKGKTKEENKEYEVMNVQLSSLLNGSKLFQTKLEHKDLLCMSYLDIKIELNQSIMTELWS